MTGWGVPAEPPVVCVPRRDAAVFTCPHCGGTGRYRTFGMDVPVGALDMDAPCNDQALTAAGGEVAFACLADRTEMRRWRLVFDDERAGDG